MRTIAKVQKSGINLLWYLAVLIVNTKNSVSQCLKFGPKWRCHHLKPILSAIFVTMPTVRVK